MPQGAPQAISSGSTPRPVPPRARQAVPPQEVPPVVPRDSYTAAPPVRIFFFADAHAGYRKMDEFTDLVREARPDLVIEGGDIVEDGTQPEFEKAWADRRKLAAETPLAMVTGNHDVLRRGPFTAEPPRLPDFQSFDRQGVHVILIDDQDELIGDDVFRKLEADLEAHKGQTTLVAMHVPPVLGKAPGLAGLGKLIPYKTVSPTMKDPAQIERLHGLMKKYEVAAVLAGHVHGPSEIARDGVQYVTVGALGGRPVGPGISHEFLDITVRGRDVQIRRVPLDKPSADPVTFMAGIGKYTADKNRFNHAALGWDSFIPRDSVQLRGGVRQSSTRHGSSTAATAGAQIEVTPGSDEKGKNAFFAESTLAVGPTELSADLAGGYKRRLLGDFNRNVYASGAAVVNGGVIASHLTGGVGARVGLGAEYKQWTFELSHERATNREMTMFSVGFRF